MAEQMRANLELINNRLNALSEAYGNDMPNLRDHLAQLDAQVIGSAPASSVPVVKLPKAEPFDGTRSKLRGFLT